MQRSGGRFFEIQYDFSFVCTHRLFLSLLFSSPFFFSVLTALFSLLSTFYFLPSPSPFISNMKFDISGLGWSIFVRQNAYQH